MFMNIFRSSAAIPAVLGRICAAGALATVVAGAAQAETWRFATLFTPENPVSKMLQSAAEEIKTETEGRITLRIAYGGESGLEARQFLDVVKMGVIDGAIISSSSVGFDYPWLSAYNIPFLATDIALRRTLFEATEPMMEEFLGEQNIVPLAYPLHAPRWSVMYLASPARTLKELSGKLIRTYDPPTTALVQGLGAAPVGLEKSEVYLGLQRKTIDGAITDIAAAREESYAEVVTAILRLNALLLPNIIGVNRATFERASPEDQETVLRIFNEHMEAYWSQITPDGEDDSFDYVTERDIEVIIPDEEMTAAMLKVRDGQLELVRASGDRGRQVVEIIEAVLLRNDK